MIFNESETDTILSGLYELQTNHEVNDLQDTGVYPDPDDKFFPMETDYEM
jgi:hypothetical protein